VELQPAPVQVDYQPDFPTNYRPGIGIVGVGGIVKQGHLPAYNKYNLNIVGVYDVSAEATRGIAEQFKVHTVFDSLGELLSHPGIEVVDVATHPKQRIPIIREALEAGKHVLSQKPLALDIAGAREVIEEAQRRGLRLAVNQNGRWSPPWRIATLLVQNGVIGDVLAVTHLYDMSLAWTVGTHFDEIEQFAIYDYSVHWFDITRCWLEKKTVSSVRARDYRTPNQPADSKTPWGMWAEITYDDGSNAMIRGVSCANSERQGHPFWIHGTEGTVRGSTLGNDFVELERDGMVCRYHLEGQWYPDGFAGTMGELLCAIDEEREPYNSASHNLLSLQITLAACRSAKENGQPVKVEGS
jgi:predicted dehydrogenase